MQEYFAFPERFLFVEMTRTAIRFQPVQTRMSWIWFFFSIKAIRNSVDVVDASHFNLFCTPAINLFPKRCDRVHLSNRTAEYHIVPDRTRADGL